MNDERVSFKMCESHWTKGALLGYLSAEQVEYASKLKKSTLAQELLKERDRSFSSPKFSINFDRVDGLTRERVEDLKNLESFIASKDKANCPLSEEMKKEAVAFNYDYYKYFKNPSEELNLFFVQLDGKNLQFIEDPSDRVQIEAIRQNVYAIKHMKDPSEAVQLEAVKRSWGALAYIKDPSDAVKRGALHNNPWAIGFIKDPSEELQLEAVGIDGDAIEYIENPSLKVQLEAVRNTGFAIRYIKDPSEQVQLEAINQNYEAITYIPYRSQKLLDEYKRVRALQDIMTIEVKHYVD